MKDQMKVLSKLLVVQHRLKEKKITDNILDEVIEEFSKEVQTSRNSRFRIYKKLKEEFVGE